VVAKVRRREEVILTFSLRGNAGLVFEIATRRVVDLNTPLLDLPRAFWKDERAARISGRP
jgi:hypothetical protein